MFPGQPPLMVPADILFDSVGRKECVGPLAGLPRFFPYGPPSSLSRTLPYYHELHNLASFR